MLTQAQIAAATGKIFEVPRVINGCARVQFVGIWPTGNVAVKRASDPEMFGPLTVSSEVAAPLMEAIQRRFNRRGQPCV
ncbi:MULTISPECIES: hypothetical protein [Achromobacter]|uniref:Uncharacterized protein n=1 Tax=Achromobacter xylosoxidans (strain A8) TaxID=762376 RepID=E3HYB5_ACHXA|nr:hypothetical protein [Achromobacter xylosoxidans]ADP20069.1 hypothetical protein AXYL_06787 [Achromobacter xylosoxidans A8]